MRIDVNVFGLLLLLVLLLVGVWVLERVCVSMRARRVQLLLRILV